MSESILVQKADGKFTFLTGSDAGAVKVQTVGSALRTQAVGTVTIGTGAAHSAGDVVSTDAGAIIQFETGLAAGSSGLINSSLTILARNAVFTGGAGYTLHLYTVSPTVQATNAVFDLVTGDVAKYIGKITIGTLVDIGSTCVVTDTAHNLDFTLAPTDTKLYGKLVCNGGETTVTGIVLTIKLGIRAI